MKAKAISVFYLRHYNNWYRWHDLGREEDGKWDEFSDESGERVVVQEKIDHPPVDAYVHVATFAVENRDDELVREQVFRSFNIGTATSILGVRSMSVGDIVVVDGTPYIAEEFGFKKAEWFEWLNPLLRKER